MKIINGVKMYDSKEVSALLGVNGTTLISYRRKGLLRSVRMGRGYYTSEESLRDYLNGKTLPKPSEK